LELPLAEATDEISLDGVKIAMSGMAANLTATDGAKVIGTWKDGTAGSNANDVGQRKSDRGRRAAWHSRMGVRG
jgi:hypothetical protein